MTQHCLALSLVSLVGIVVAKHGSYNCKNCIKVHGINFSSKDIFCDQPLFLNFVTSNENNRLLDNVCFTAFPLPDDPDTFAYYISRVFCDGSNEITSAIVTSYGRGVFRSANPYITWDYTYFAYAGCDTYLVQQCDIFGDCVGDKQYVLGISPGCHPLGLSCLRKVEELLSDKGFPDQDYFVLPMKLPNRCITEQLCINPSTENRFKKSLGLSGPFKRRSNLL